MNFTIPVQHKGEMDTHFKSINENFSGLGEYLGTFSILELSNIMKTQKMAIQVST
jgi:hypothetical protein